MPETLGLRASRRDHLGEDQSASADYPDGTDWALAQPRERALPGRYIRVASRTIPSPRGKSTA
ncbi:hypothetical protein chiPu_0031758, partial [Chiloscyllium punctatum]|nr:hypothetical protein [Chiloscyllium punctatum]